MPDPPAENASAPAPVPDGVLIVCGDLFFASQLGGAAARAGLRSATASFASQIPGKLSEERYRFLVLDLETPSLDAAAVMRSLGDGERPRVIAFGPHVYKERLDAARAAGCDLVLSRGQISTDLERLLTASG